MEAKEFGKEHSRKILLIPGNMMSWRQFRNVVPILEKDFHVIAVSTDGYDGALSLYETIDLFEPDPEAKVSIWHGAREPNMKIALKKLRRAFPHLEDHPFEGMGHGDIIGHPQLMAEEIKKWMDR